MLVANRGEIAVRVIRTLKRMGIRSVAIYSDADAGALHVREADVAVRVGASPAAESYLDTEAVIEACRRSGAQAVHPGYGFLSENIEFARALKNAGIVFIGPGIDALLLMGDKIRSKNHVSAHDVPVTPGIAEPELSDEELIDAAAEIGFPVLIKPSAGGGGKGMVAVDSPDELPAALASARRTALSSFGDDTLFLERLVRARGTSRCRSSPTPTATPCTSASANAPCSAGTRRSSRKPPPRCWNTRRTASASAPRSVPRQWPRRSR